MTFVARGHLTIAPRSRYAKYFVPTRWRRVSMSTEFPSKNEIVRKWHVLDADGAILGKLASKAARLLMGKQMYRKLKVYAGDRHPHQAQQPTPMAV